MLHGIGLYHTHTRTDRDEYITINSNNIAASRKNEFDMCKRNCETYDTPYDCDSIMHYASNQMATDKDKATICEIIINIDWLKTRVTTKMDFDYSIEYRYQGYQE